MKWLKTFSLTIIAALLSSFFFLKYSRSGVLCFAPLSEKKSIHSHSNLSELSNDAFGLKSYSHFSEQMYQLSHKWPKIKDLMPTGSGEGGEGLQGGGGWLGSEIGRGGGFGNMKRVGGRGPKFFPCPPLPFLTE